MDNWTRRQVAASLRAAAAKLEDRDLNEAKILNLKDFLDKYSAEYKDYASTPPHGYIVMYKNNPYIKLNGEYIEVTPSEYDSWDQLILKNDYKWQGEVQPVLLTYTRRYSDAQVQDGHHRVKYIIDKGISGKQGYFLDDRSLIDFWKRNN